MGIRALLKWRYVRRLGRALREEPLPSVLRKVRHHVVSIMSGGASGTVTGRSTLPSDGLHGFWRMLGQNDSFHINHTPAYISRKPHVTLIGDLNLPQCRKFRVEQLREIFALMGVDYSYAHFEDRLRWQANLQTASHLIVYRLQSDDIFSDIVYEARRLKLPIMYDLDDPIFSVPAYETYSNMQAVNPHMREALLRAAPRYATAMNGADILSMSTPTLCAEARKFVTAPVVLRRNFCDAQTLSIGAAADRRARPFCFLFASGSSGHEKDFDLIAEPLCELAREGHEFALRILGPFDMSHCPPTLRAHVRHTPFARYENYLSHMRSADVALVPLQDELFNQCKSAVRPLDASALGLPSLVSAVGDAHQIVSDQNGDGIVTTANSDWYDALKYELESRDACRERGIAARKNVETTWRAQLADHIVDPIYLDWVRG